MLLGVVLATAGCAAPLPKLDPPLPVQWRHALAADPGAKVDLRHWWQAFGDHDLDALVERALSGNLDVAQARERLLAARALHARSSARYRPQLSARTADAIDPDASAAFFVAGFDATWELGVFGRAEGTARTSRATVDAAQAQWRMARVSLVAEVVREWITLRTAQQEEQLLGEASAAQDRSAQLLAVRQRLQLASPAVAAQAQAAAAQALAALAAPRQVIDASAQRLALLTGANQPDPAWSKPGTPPALGAWHVTSAPAELLRTRPEIALAEAEVLRAAGELALAHADQYPSVGLGGSLLWATDLNNNHHFSTTPNDIASFGPVINIPLFDWGMRLAARQAKDHELTASLLAYRQAILQAVAEVETALGNLQQAAEREKHHADAWHALQRVVQATATRQRLHLASPLEGANAELAVSQAGIELADARAARSLAYVALYKALGGAALDSDADAAPLPLAQPTAAAPPARTR